MTIGNSVVLPGIALMRMPSGVVTSIQGKYAAAKMISSIISKPFIRDNRPKGPIMGSTFALFLTANVSKAGAFSLTVTAK